MNKFLEKKEDSIPGEDIFKDNKVFIHSFPEGRELMDSDKPLCYGEKIEENTIYCEHLLLQCYYPCDEYTYV